MTELSPKQQAMQMRLKALKRVLDDAIACTEGPSFDYDALQEEVDRVKRDTAEIDNLMTNLWNGG